MEALAAKKWVEVLAENSASAEMETASVGFSACNPPASSLKSLKDVSVDDAEDSAGDFGLASQGTRSHTAGGKDKPVSIG